MMMTKNEKIILASASPRRRELLEQIGIHPEIIPSTVEEHIESSVPEEVVKELSFQKAEDVYKKIKEETQSPFWVIGADTVVAHDGKILGKPKTHEEAAEMIQSLQGKTHQVYTGVTLIGHDRNREHRKAVFAECTDVTVYPMSQEEVMSYAMSEEPMDKAGAYGIQGCFAAYIEKICGDYNNVVGLPVGRVVQELKKMR